MAKEEAERKMREMEERKVREDAERRAREEADRKAKEMQKRLERERKARERRECLERERIAREEAERKIHETEEHREADWLKACEEEKGKAGMVKRIVLPGGAEMELVYCPFGEFMMGSPTTEEGRVINETQHRVRLTKSFWLGKYPVTQAQWKSVMGNNPLGFKGDDRPVECVSWDDCQQFIAKVNAALNCGARLPTEAEWEYACRAGTTGAYGGTGNLDEMGWYGDNSECYTKMEGGSTDDTEREMRPVGTKEANAWELCDMHGNVWEWCQDCYGDYPKGNVTDPIGPASGKSRVLRGGCWEGLAWFCRSAYRHRSYPGLRYYCNGFRLCFSAGPHE